MANFDNRLLIEITVQVTYMAQIVLLLPIWVLLCNRSLNIGKFKPILFLNMPDITLIVYVLTKYCKMVLQKLVRQKGC